MAFGAGPAGNRLIAASQALGAPKGVGKPDKASSKLPMRPQKGNPMPRHNADPHPAQHGQPAHAGPQEHLGLIGMTPQQLNQRATSIAQAQGNTELAPLRTQANELKGTEAATQNRFKALGEAQQGTLGKIGEQAQQGALTAQNQAANNALKAAQSVETSGQAQAGLTGGYISPEAKAELAAEGQRAAGEAGAGKSLAEQSGTNENNYLANLRAAAAAKATEGSSQIASQYGKALKENSAKQGEVAGRIGANTLKLQTELPEKQFNELATKEGLGLKGTAIEAKAGETAARVKATLRGQNVTAENNRRTTATSEANNRRTTATSEANKRADLVYKETHPAGTKSTAPKAPSPATATKYIAEVSSAEAKANLWLGSKKNDPAQQRKTREALIRAGATADQASAAMNLAVYGVLGPNDREAAKAYGEVGRLRPAWFKPHK